MKAGKIEGLTRINVNGHLYEWNAFLMAYWSVRGEPRELQIEDLAGAEVAAA